jgi:hypothetical protein
MALDEIFFFLRFFDFSGSPWYLFDLYSPFRFGPFAIPDRRCFETNCSSRPLSGGCLRPGVPAIRFGNFRIYFKGSLKHRSGAL